MVSKGTSASRLSRCQCSSLTYLHRDAERRGSAASHPLCIPAVRAAAFPRQQHRQKERVEGLAQATAQKQKAPTKPQGGLPSQWLGPSCLQNNGREQGSWEEVYTCECKHYPPLIPQTHLMTFLGPWGLLFYPSLNHLVLVKLFYYKIHQMLSNKDEQ